MSYELLKWRLDDLEKVTSKNSLITIDRVKKTISFPSGKKYIPTKTGLAFHTDTSRSRLIKGAIRSGKSTMSCAEVIFRAVDMPRCKDGVKRAVCAIIRNTYPELTTTTVRTWKAWYRELGTVRERYDSPISFSHTFKVAYTDSDVQDDVELLVWFLALDKEKDISKLLSLELSFAYINESRELPFSVFEHLRGRVGQYPAKVDLEDEAKPFWYGIFADTNPPDTDHWIYRVYEVEKPKGFKLFDQPPALLVDADGIWRENPEADNIGNLPSGYYQELLPGSTKEYQNVYILGRYGAVYDGQVVYPNYNDDLHAGSVQAGDGDLYIGWDFGLTPAALIGEYRSGSLYLLKEFTTERMYLDELISIVVPYLQTHFKGRTITSECDPSGSELYMQALEKAGIPTNKCDTPKIEDGISAVNTFLTKISCGKASLQIDKVGCPMLRKGFLGKYCYKRLRVIGEEKYRDVPDKTHPYSDIQDALKYICRKISSNLDRPPITFGSPILSFQSDWV